MEIKALNKVIGGVSNATVTMSPGEFLSIGIKIKDTFQIVNINAQGSVILVEHKQTKDAMLIKPSGNVFVKD